MSKEHIIRQADAKEYISFQFQGLTQTLEQFDYPSVAEVVRAAHAVFQKSLPETSESCMPDCVLLNAGKTKS